MNKLFFFKSNRALLAELVRTDFKLRYQNSVLGYAWSLLRPLFLFFILYMVFIRFLKIGADIPHAPIYLLLGIVLWNFFVEMTSQSLGSIVARGDLIRKIRIPRWIIIFSTSFAALINLALNLLVVGIFMYFNKVPLTATALLLPVLIIELYIFALGVSFFLAAAFVKYRDIVYIWEVFTQAAFYATPILYPMSRIESVFLQKLIFINPIAQIIQDARYSIVTHTSTTISSVYSPLGGYVISLSLIVLFCVIGVTYFKRQSLYFAENL